MTETWHETPSEKEQLEYKIYNLEYKIYKLEKENKRLRETLKTIKEVSSCMSANEITIYDLIDIYNICCDALEGKEE